MGRIPRLLTLLAVAISIVGSLHAQKVDERGRQIVVQIAAKFGGATRVGAGIIFARTNGRVYIATANHVIRDEQTAANSVVVDFGGLPGEQFPGNVLAPLRTNLDLAVLVVPDTNIPSNLFPTKILGNVSKLQRRDPVYAVGHPNGRSWEIPVAPDYVSQVTAGMIDFQSKFVQNGNSGGALMDEAGNLLGIVIEDNQPNAVAISIDTVLSALRAAGYAIQLTASDATPAPGAAPPRPTPGPAPDTAADNLSGTWEITQTSPENTILFGTLQLSQRGTTLSGGVVWTTHRPGQVIGGTVQGNRVSFIMEYSGDLQGVYEGSLDASRNRMDGSTEAGDLKQAGSLYANKQSAGARYGHIQWRTGRYNPAVFIYNRRILNGGWTMGRIARTLTLLAVTISIAGPLHAQKVDERGRQIVVQIAAKFGGATRVGAGIIFARTNGRVYIATANHVIRDEQTAANSVVVDFGSLPGEQFPGNVLAPLRTNLDLGVLVVPDTNIPNNLFPTKVLGNAAKLQRRDPVYAVGHPNGRSWEIPVAPDFVSQVTAGMIDFQSKFVQNGNSGGALMDEAGNLLGMVIEDSQPNAVAISIDTVLSALRAAGYAIQLTAADAASSQPSQPVQPPTRLSDECNLDVQSTPAGATILLDGDLEDETPATVKLNRQAGKHDLTLTMDGYQDFQTQVDCSTGRIAARLRAAAPRTGDITLRYLGDFAACTLDLQVKVGNRTFHPTSNLFAVPNLPLGSTPYTVTGQIQCPTLGFCTANGAGNILVENGATYDVAWLNVAFGSCAVTLTKSLF